MESIRPAFDDKIIFLGDYIDRGPDSKKVIDYIMDLQLQGRNIIALKGNHEELFLKSQQSEDEMNIWIRNGGKLTLDSFGVATTWQIEKPYFDFIESMPYYYIFENYYFVHAGFNEGKNAIFEDNNAMLWIRKETYYSDYFMGKHIIHGHTPQPLVKLKKQIEKRNLHTINIDTGCIRKDEDGYGYLSAIEMNSLEIFSVRNID